MLFALAFSTDPGQGLGGLGGTLAEFSSTMAPVSEADEGFFTRPATAQEEACAAVGMGKFPATEASPVAGTVPVT